jgi:hypothetical protein
MIVTHNGRGASEVRSPHLNPLPLVRIYLAPKPFSGSQIDFSLELFTGLNEMAAGHQTDDPRVMVLLITGVQLRARGRS